MEARSQREVLATGLRNTIGFAWHPVTKELWGWDHGIDWLGDDQQGEEFNMLVHGARYGLALCVRKEQAESGGRASWRNFLGRMGEDEP
jgi:glucose/arabinose dehydrogenase